MHRLFPFAAFALGAVIGNAAHAAERPVDLRPGAGRDRVEQNCGGCHSLDYILMNGSFLSAEGWKAEVTKMRAAFHAPVSDADADVIQRYLAEAYGPTP